MEQLFNQILAMSLTGSIVIAAVMILRLLLKRAPRLYSYCLWAAVWFRLLCPDSFTAGFSLFSILDIPSVSYETTAYLPQAPLTRSRADTLRSASRQNAQLSQTPSTANNTDPAAQDNAAVTDSPRSNNGGTFPNKWLQKAAPYIWILGMVTMLSYHLYRLKKLKRSLKTASWDRDNLYLTQSLAAPFVIGIIRPKIYLPQNLSEKEKSYVLLHEQVHIKRKDHMIKLLSFFALCLHWFNPLVWAAFLLSEKDMEMSCDEAVIRTLGNEAKKEYSHSLLSMACRASVINGAPLGFGEGDIKSRIKNILRYQKPASIVSKCAALFCMTMILLLLANPQKQSAANDTGTNQNLHKAQAADSQSKTDHAQNSRSLSGTGTQTPSSKQQKDPAAANDPDSPPSTYGLQYLDALDKLLLPDGAAAPDRTFYALNVRHIQKNKRTIDAFIEPENTFPFQEDTPLPFSKHCTFYINYSMNGIDYEEVRFPFFVEAVNKGGYYLPKMCLLGFTDDKITCAVLKSAYEPYGITPMNTVPEAYADQNDLGSDAADETGQGFSLLTIESMDLADCPGTETAEVYTDPQVDAVLMIKTEDGKTLHTQSAGLARAGWTNIYLGIEGGIPFILNVTIEDRFNYVAYGYQAYRLDQKGRPALLASSSFSSYLGEGSNIIYDDHLFLQWIGPLEHYLKNSHLLLSTQEGQIRTEKICEADKYNYQNLNLMARAEELSEIYGGMVRYTDCWYSARSLSEDTLQWLSWFNSLPEEDQDAVSAVPSELAPIYRPNADTAADADS